MLPVCSTTTNSSCHAQVPIHGALKPFSPLDASYNNVDRTARNFSNGVFLDRVSYVESFKRRPASCFYPTYAVNGEQCGSMDIIDKSVHRIGLSSVKQLKHCSYQVGLLDESHRLEPNNLIFVESSTSYDEGNKLIDLTRMASDDAVDLPSYVDPELTAPFDGVTNDPIPEPDSLNFDVNPLSGTKTIVTKMGESFSGSFKRGENILSSSFDTVTSSVNATVTDASKAFNGAIEDIASFFNRAGDSVSNKFTSLIQESKEASGRGGLVALDVLRKAVFTVEDSLVKGAQNVGNAYGFAKESLPPEFRETVSFSEATVMKVLSPVGFAFQQVYTALEGFEKSLGLDPNDPLVQLALFLGLSTTLWGSYRVFIYGGYAGDLSPKSALQLLRENKNAVLIDIRPETFKERDGIPDNRRTARFRYVNITVPEVDDSVKKLLKGGRGVEDSLLASVIRNLKIVEGSTNILVMDADGTRSKGVARSLRKLGTKKPYIVKGGFRSWVDNDFRTKELKPETALTVLNEEAGAILEEINPTPLKLLGYGLAFAAAAYSLAEWEKSLQYIGVICLGLTIFQRVSSYQDAEDVKKDVGILLTPARLGSQAISWAAGKFETNRNGLPTSPSSSDVQSRVLQAAAKHESQPEETLDPPLMPSSGKGDINMSEA